VYDGPAYATIIVSLLVAAWCFVAASRDSWIDWTHLAGLALAEAAVVGQVVVAVARMIGGERPEQLATFLGYVIAAVALLPAAVGLSFMERTRWGSIIAGAGVLVLAVLVLRLLQVWTPLQ
jgi:hypothetical protein